LAALFGCGTGEGASYIVLDEPARAARVEVEVGGRAHGGALPLEVESGMPVDLLTPTGRRPLTVATGMVYEVRGSTASVVSWSLTEQVRTDVVEVGGPEPIVRNLASALGARSPEPWNGRWRLEGPDVLLRLAWMGDLADVTQVVVVLTERAREEARAEWTAPAAGARARPDRAAPAFVDPALSVLVGLYTSDAAAGERPATLFLDAEGGFALQKECDPSPVHGTYRQHDGRLELDGTNLALTIGQGRLEAPGLVFSTGEDK